MTWPKRLAWPLLFYLNMCMGIYKWTIKSWKFCFFQQHCSFRMYNLKRKIKIGIPWQNINVRCHLGFWPFLEWPTILSQWQKLSLAFFSGPNAFSPPLNFLPYTRLKFAPVSNIARICGEKPPSIHLIPWMQFRGGLSDW